ncbi:DUF4440 domain-containing protein [bacterium]|nr:DUF4440 domain-containing protein [bacterium]
MKRIMSYLFYAAVLLGVSCIEYGGEPFDPAAEKAAVRAVLDAQVAGWNSGDLTAYMQGYAHTDSLRFASGGTVRYGWEATLQAYRRGYPDRERMGHLVFSEVDIRMLSPDAALVFGRWQLEREEDSPWGLYTLIVRKTAGGWRVVHDHTSSAAE